MKQKLTETQLHNIVAESVKNILSEISWQTADKAYDKSVNIVEHGDLEDALDDFIGTGEKLIELFKQYNGGQANETISIIKNCLSNVKKFSERKISQSNNLEGFAQDKFADAHNGKSQYQYMNSPESENDEEFNKHIDSKFESKNSSKSLVKEENENASDPKWILWACRLCILNNRDIYNLYDWLVKAINKKRARGIEPSLEQLTKSSTMQKIVRMAFKANDIVPKNHPEEFQQVCYNTAKEIME